MSQPQHDLQASIQKLKTLVIQPQSQQQFASLASLSSALENQTSSSDNASSQPPVQDALARLESRMSSTNTTAQPHIRHSPPRKHILQTPVFQVVNANTVKDRYLFLFSDLLLICKPIMDENIIIGGGDQGGRYRFRPNENSLFQVKNIVELSKVTLYLSRKDQYSSNHRATVAVDKEGRPVLSHPRKMHPVLQSALRKFESNAELGIAYLLDKQVLTNDPPSIANFLFKTPDLNRRQLGYFFADPKNKDVYDAFLDCFRLAGLRLDEALRILLTTFRLPSHWEGLEYLIERFAKKWHDANQNVVKFHEDMVVKVVVAMLFLNAQIWFDASSEHDVFWSARERKERRDRTRVVRRASMDSRANRESVAIEPLHYITAQRAKGSTRPALSDFLDQWRYYDQYSLVPREFLEDMYRSILTERLETGWDRNSRSDAPLQPLQEGETLDGEPDTDAIITVTPYRFPTRLTKNVPSAPITISIPKPDPGLQIKLRGQDLICKPSVLDFSRSCVQTFTVTGSTLGRTSLMFIKAGPNASRYISPTLPRTKSIVVERAFMRYTFQIGFSHTDMRALNTNIPSSTGSTSATKEAGSLSYLTDHVTTPGIAEEAGPILSVTPAQETEPPKVSRKYTFSVETEEERTEWVNNLKQLCGHLVTSAASGDTKSTVTRHNPNANPGPLTSEERVAMQVLKEVLLADEVKKGTANVTVLRNTLMGGVRSSMIDVSAKLLDDGKPTSAGLNSDMPWGLQSPDKEDIVFLDGKDKEENTANSPGRIKSTGSGTGGIPGSSTGGGDRTSLPATATTNVVTKRGHEIVKLVVQNSMVPLMLGFLRRQIE